MRFFGLILFWGIYFPVLKLLTLLFLWHPKVWQRLKFEKKNKLDALAESFKKKKMSADLCFEFSSEGEFQQVASLIEDALSARKIIELVFFSPSVEKAIKELAAKHPDQIRYLRYPFLGCGFSSWITSKTLIMVRYDLFPEFLLWALKPGHELKMIWMSFKKESVRHKKVTNFKLTFLKTASTVIYASEKDRRIGESFGLPGSHYDFRMEQIRRRIEKKDEKFKVKLPVYNELKKHLMSYPSEKLLLIGNAWPSDLFLFRDLPPDYLVMIVPHELKTEILEQFRLYFKELGREVSEINEEGKHFKPSSTIILNKKGVLCELYADFNKAYVGGGFGSSVHSILEPLVGGSVAISSGPNHIRSTEFDVALGYGQMTEVNSPEEFLSWLEYPLVKHLGHGKMDEVFHNYVALRNKVISC